LTTIKILTSRTS